MKLDEIKNEDMCALVAPDGSIQISTMAPDLPMCIAMIKILHKAGVSKSYHEMTMKGYKVLPVKVTVVQNGSEDEMFENFKQSIK